MNFFQLKTKFPSADFYRLLLITKVAKFFIKNGKKIYGGLVRDMLMLQQQMKNFANEFPNEDFWDPTIGDIEKRVIIPKDIDVLFSNVRVKELKLYKYVAQKGFYFDIVSVNDYDARNELILKVDPDSRYSERKISVFHVKAVLINWNIFTDKEISCEIDLITSRGQPPFGIGDMECNLFSLDKNGINLMENTGTKLDEMSIFEKELERSRIIFAISKRITKFFPRTPRHSHSQQLKFCERVIKMLLKKWKITNLKSVEALENCTLTSESEAKCIAKDCPFSVIDPELRLNHCKKFMHAACLLSDISADLSQKPKDEIPCCEWSVISELLGHIE